MRCHQGPATHQHDRDIPMWYVEVAWTAMRLIRLNQRHLPLVISHRERIFGRVFGSRLWDFKAQLLKKDEGFIFL
jgi:hypothetical protein